MQTVRHVQRNVKFAVVTNTVPSSDGRYYGFAHLLNGDVETMEVIYFHVGDYLPVKSSAVGPRFTARQNTRKGHVPLKPGDRIVCLVIPAKKDGQRPKARPWGNAQDWQLALQQMEASA